MYKASILALTMATTVCLPSFAAENADHSMHTDKMDHSSMEQSSMDHGSMDHSAMSNGQTMPTEGGQGTFAAIIEIVSILESSPDTDWSQVDIDALHAHLVDMNTLMLHTSATKEMVTDNTIQFDVKAKPQAMSAAHSMVPTHAGYIQSARGWDISTTPNASGVLVTVTTDSAAVLEKLYALGFYGFMSLESHHQMHHFHMARGGSH